MPPLLHLSKMLPIESALLHFFLSLQLFSRPPHKRKASLENVVGTALPHGSGFATNMPGGVRFRAEAAQRSTGQLEASLNKVVAAVHGAASKVCNPPRTGFQRSVYFRTRMVVFWAGSMRFPEPANTHHTIW